MAASAASFGERTGGGRAAARARAAAGGRALEPGLVQTRGSDHARRRSSTEPYEAGPAVSVPLLGESFGVKHGIAVRIEDAGESLMEELIGGSSSLGPGAGDTSSRGGDACEPGGGDDGDNDEDEDLGGTGYRGAAADWSELRSEIES